MLKLCLLFFLSGASGLIYQVVWVRQFSNVFGSSVYSASLVTGIFMLGLGSGSYLAGRWIDARAKTSPHLPLKAYGVCELGIAILGLALALILPQMEGLSASLTEYHRGADGWFEPTSVSSFARYAIATLLLTPITAAMGATLTLLVRHLLSGHLAESGWRVGLLYGVNTAGAAMGCLATDIMLIPTVGLLSTQAVAILLNLIAGLGALRLAASEGEPSTTSEVGALPFDTEPAPRWQLVAIAVALSGFAGMAMEIVWFRHLISLLGGYRTVFSVLLFVILTGTWMGAVFGGLWHRRFGHPALGYALAQACFVAGSLFFLSQLERSDVLELSMANWREASASASAQRWSGFWTNLRVSIFAVGLPALCMGAAYPLSNALVQRASTSIGTRAGELYLFNTFGAVFGAIVGGFVLLPKFGTQTSTAIATAIAVVLIPLLAIAEPPKKPIAKGLWAAAALLGAGGLFGWLQLPPNQLLSQTVPSNDEGKVLASSEGVSETISVVQLPLGRILATNGHNMSANTPAAQRYMRAFVHLPLLHLDAPKDVLVVCFGVGTTLQATSLYEELERIEVVDISRHVLEHAQYFEETNRGVLRDPRVSVYVNDGRQHLRAMPANSYDLITSEPPPIAHAGVAALYSVEYYELARSRLRPGGLISQWLPAYQQTSEVVRQMIKAFVQVFPDAILVSGVEKELILLASKETPLLLSPEQIQRRLAARPAVKRDLENMLMGDAIEIFGAFIAGPKTLSELTANDAAVTDDFPALEYSRHGLLLDVRLPEGLFAVEEVGVWCPTCVEPDSAIRAPLLAYLSVRNKIYRSNRFMNTRALGPEPAKLDIRRNSPEFEAILKSSYLQSVLGSPGGTATSTRTPRFVAP